jgi:tetratricopeptide (TPR) repeat protein
MSEKRLKNIFYLSSAFLLIMMLLFSRNAGITCDEVLHYNHSVSVYNYFASHGADKSALNTPVTNLKYYGQSYDDIVTIIIKWFHISDVYGFRHLMSSLAGWLAIFVTALFAIWLMDYRAGILVLVLFAVSPTFMGHAQNNLKDIPFALSYISGIFLVLRYLSDQQHGKSRDLLLLTLSIAFSISIRAGGLILLCYIFLFLFVFSLFRYYNEKRISFTDVRRKFLWLCGVLVAAWGLSIIIWPYALQGPVRNVIESYRVMAHFPSTFRQIFEGKMEWSDFMPWYYLPKSMMITIPLIVLAGIVFLIFFSFRKRDPLKKLITGCLVFSVLFPVFFVIVVKSNLYSSWRQFLFVYPGIVLIASLGYLHFYNYLKKWYLKLTLALLLLVLALNPLKFMLANPGYHYMYYNQLVGGLKGAESNYETDYYFQGQTEASKWLIDYLNKKDSSRTLKVMANYSVEWQFRMHPEITTSYLRYEERSMNDWDYGIVTNRYITPFQLRNNIWPPENTIHTVYADNVPICAVIERRSKDDLAGYIALSEGRNSEAVALFEKALKIDKGDEMIFFNFAASLYNEGQYQKADSVLQKGLEVNPDFEPILMYLGNIAKFQNKSDKALEYYERVVKVNRKYFEAYVGISELLKDRDVVKARRVLMTCLEMSPRYKPAIIALADTYRNSNPDIAKKYDELASSIN